MGMMVRNIIQLALAEVLRVSERPNGEINSLLRLSGFQRLFRQRQQRILVRLGDLALAALPNMEGVMRQQVQGLFILTIRV